MIVWYKWHPASAINNILQAVWTKPLNDLIFIEKFLNIFWGVPSHLIQLGPHHCHQPRKVTTAEVIQAIRANPSLGTLNCIVLKLISPHHYAEEPKIILGLSLRYPPNPIAELLTVLHFYYTRIEKTVNCTTISMYFSLLQLDIAMWISSMSAEITWH